MAKRRKKKKGKKTKSDNAFLFLVLVIAVGGSALAFDLSSYIGELFASTVFLTVGVATSYIFLRLWRSYNKMQKEFQENARLRGFHLTNRILHINPYDFEHLVKLVMENEGGTHVVVTERSGDEGIDLKCNMHGERVLVQVKRYRPGNNIGRVDLQQFVGAYSYKTKAGWFITTSDFNKNAREYAKNFPDMRLVNGAEFGLMLDKLPDTDWMEEFLTHPLRLLRHW